MSTERKQTLWQSGWMNTVGRFLALIVVFVFFAVLVEDGKFYTPRNLENILRQSAVYGTAGLGMTMVIITAGIDLSVGSIIALAVVVVAWVLNLPAGDDGYLIQAWPVLLPILAVIAGVIAAGLAGMANGAIIVGLRLVPFIVTLGMMGIVRGLAKGIAGMRDIYPEEDTWISSIMDPTLTSADRPWMHLPPGVWILIVGLLLASFLLRFTRLGRHIPAVGSNEEPARLGGLPVGRIKLIVYTLTGLLCGIAGLVFLMRLPPGVWILIVGVLFTSFLLRYTRFGRHVYAVGSNEETARLCGVPVGRTKLIVYTLTGLFCGVAGLMQFSYIAGIGQPTTAVMYELFVIAAVIIGGASFSGGEGSVLGTLIGALIITILYMGGQQMGWPKWVQEMVIGGIIIAAVALDQFRHRKA